MQTTFSSTQHTPSYRNSTDEFSTENWRGRRVTTAKTSTISTLICLGLFISGGICLSLGKFRQDKELQKVGKGLIIAGGAYVGTACLIACCMLCFAGTLTWITLKRDRSNTLNQLRNINSRMQQMSRQLDESLLATSSSNV
ncbi:MAG: hypothetical protein K0S74_1777 [Chlamydiales bacterium]|jgi:hypothetical protein|nr:hypothetical protein [Chlamydiales bacterium]